VSGKAKISLNEIGFGSSVFAGSAEMLKLCVGKRNAETILLGGAMYSAEQARALGLVDEVVAERELMDRAVHAAQEWAGRDAAAFASIKGLLRQPVAEEMERREKASIRRFAEIWYSEGTREKLKGIQIHA
jgi:enoyl-CoA hydratase/carnithine racemase